MTNPTVSTPETTGERSGKFASKLQEGDWIAADVLDGFKTEAQVLSAHEHAGRVLLVLATPSGEPLPRSMFSDHLIALATADEIEAAKAARYRKAAAAQLADIAALFEIHNSLPLPGDNYGLHVDIQCDTAAEVVHAGELLGVEPQTTASGKTVMTTVQYPPAPVGTPRYLHQPPASITWRSYEKPEQVADTGLDYSRELDAPTAAPIPAGVDGLKVGGRANGKARRP